jgi:hypothetical protein
MFATTPPPPIPSLLASSCRVAAPADDHRLRGVTTTNRGPDLCPVLHNITHICSMCATTPPPPISSLLASSCRVAPAGDRCLRKSTTRNRGPKLCPVLQHITHICNTCATTPPPPIPSLLASSCRVGAPAGNCCLRRATTSNRGPKLIHQPRCSYRCGLRS